MAAATVANLLKIRKETIRKSLEHFQGIEHRLENVLTINKVKYINLNKSLEYYDIDDEKDFKTASILAKVMINV